MGHTIIAEIGFIEDAALPLPCDVCDPEAPEPQAMLSAFCNEILPQRLV